MADMIKSKKDTDASRKRKRESAPVACSSCRKQHLKVRSALDTSRARAAVVSHVRSTRARS